MTSTARLAELPAYVAGEPVTTDRRLQVYYPYDGRPVGSVPRLGVDELDRAVNAALVGGPVLTPYRRYEILDKARRLLLDRAEDFAHGIRLESGLCMADTRYEVGRAADVLLAAAMVALQEGGSRSPAKSVPTVSRVGSLRCTSLLHWSALLPRSTIRSIRWRTRWPRP